MTIRRATDDSVRQITQTHTELQRLQLGNDGANLLPLKAVLDLSTLNTSSGTLRARALAPDGTEALRLEQDVVGGGVVTLSLADRVDDVPGADAAVQASEVVLEYETASPDGSAIQTQLVAYELPELPSGTPSMRTSLGADGGREFPDGGALVHAVETTDGDGLLPLSGIVAYSEDLLGARLTVRFLTETASGVFDEVFRFEGDEQDGVGAVHLPQVVPGFDAEPDGSFPVDRVELWLDPTAETSVTYTDPYLVAAEV